MTLLRIFAGAFPASVLIAAPCGAQIVLSQPTFEAGQNYAAFFKVVQGCHGSPTRSLSIDMPAGVEVLRTPEKPGWTVAPRLRGDRVVSITWRGRLDSETADQFGLLLKLPKRPGPIYFSAVQRCDAGERRWTEIPGHGQTPRVLVRPAPMLVLTAANAPAPSAPDMVMAGSLMIEQPWAPATPPGAPTAAGYLTIVNRGTAPDTLTGGTSPAAVSVQVHQMSMANGVMSMREMKDGLPIPAGAALRLDPAASYHLMLVGLKQPLKQGTAVPVTLDFAKAGKVQVQFRVAAIGARAPDSGASPMTGMNMPGMDHR